MIALGFAERAQLYARQVVSGGIPACKWVKAAAQRHLDDLERSETDPSWPYRFDREKAQRICEFKELLPHVKGDWAKPVVVDGKLTYPKIVLEDWQVFVNAVIFGWVHRVTGLRRFRRAYIEVARKNAKSTDIAGTALYMLAADGEQGPEVYCCATKKDQAKIIWEEVACQMVHREPEFKALGVGFNRKRIYCTLNSGKFEPLARDYGSLDGLNTSCFISDELHAQKDRRLYDVLDSSTGARSQPLGIGITTAGVDRSGVCYAQRRYVVKLLNAVLHRHGGMGYKVKGGRAEDDAYFGIIYKLDSDYAPVPCETPEAQEAARARGWLVDEAKKTATPPDDDWADESVWPKANPMLLAVHNRAYAETLLADLRAMCQKARTMPSEQGEFRTKRCNEWIGADLAWMDMRAWNACEDPYLTEEELAGEPACIGLDAAFKTDIFAKVKVIRRGENYYVFGRYYAPQHMLRKEGNEQLASWADEGLIVETPGKVLDIERVREDLREDLKKHDVREVPYDPAQLSQFAGEMLEEGTPMVEMRPTVLNFSEPMKKLEELVLQGRLIHNGDPVLEWMVSNVVCHRDHKDNIYPNKEAPENKIDGVVALIMALGRMMYQVDTSLPTEVLVV